MCKGTLKYNGHVHSGCTWQAQKYRNRSASVCNTYRNEIIKAPPIGNYDL